MGKTSTAAKNKYNSKTYDRLFVVVSKGKKDIIQKYAEGKGMSINAYINMLIDNDMK